MRTLLLVLLCPAMLAQSTNPEVAPSANLQRSASPGVMSELTTYLEISVRNVPSLLRFGTCASAMLESRPKTRPSIFSRTH